MQLSSRQCVVRGVRSSVFRSLKNKDVFAEAYREVFTAVLKTLDLMPWTAITIPH